MQSDESNYVHRPINGLPASLISLDGTVLPVIALMQREAGLNRERRREMQSEAHPYGNPDARLRRVVSKTDWSALTYYLSASERFGSFWHVVKCMLEPHGRRGAKAFAVAVDVPLLKAYEPGWLTLQFDESTLTADCEEWLRIRSYIEKYSGFDQGRTPLGMFMLWPRLLVDLKRWEDLNTDRQLKVGHAIFALSSIGWTDWFVAKAVACRPELQPELGTLLKARVQAATDDELGQTAEELHMGEAEQIVSTGACAGGADDPGTSDDPWGQMMQRLDAVAAELREHPTREAVDDLSQVALEFASMRESLPQRLGSVAEQFEERHRDLMVFLAETAARPGFEWLDAAMLSQLDARWRLACAECDEPDQIAELGADGAAAIVRTGEASEAFVRAAESAKMSRQLTQTAEQALATAKGFGQQAMAKRQHSDAQRHAIETEAAQLTTQERLIDAASPFAEPFDFSADYVARLDHKAVVTSDEDVSIVVETAAPASTTSPLETASRSEELSSPVESNVSHTRENYRRPAETRHPGSSIEFAVEATAESSQAAIPCCAPEPETTLLADQPNDDPVEGNECLAETPGVPEQGAAARHIWQLLGAGEYALAYHLALGTPNPTESGAPSPLLLRALIAGTQLRGPHGALAKTLEDCVAQLDGDTDLNAVDPNLNCALNLLASAATVRSGLLAPMTGAASVLQHSLSFGAGWDALHQLSQTVGETAQHLYGVVLGPDSMRRRTEVKNLDADRHRLAKDAKLWLEQQCAWKAAYKPAVAVWQDWCAREDGYIRQLIEPALLADTTRPTAVWGALLTKLSDADEVVRQIHETDRRLRGSGYARIDYKALDLLKRRTAEAVEFANSWLALVPRADKSDYIELHIQALDTGIEAVRWALMNEIASACEQDDLALSVAGTCLKREIDALYALLSPNDEQEPAQPEGSLTQAFNLAVLRLPGCHLTSDGEPELDPQTIASAILDFSPEQTHYTDCVNRKIEERDFAGADALLQTGPLTDPERTELLRRYEDQLKTSRAEMLARCKAVQASLESAFRSGLIAPEQREQDAGILSEIAERTEEELHLYRHIQRLNEISRAIEEAAASRLREIRGRLDALRMADGDAHREAVLHLLERSDALAAEEYVDHLAHGQKPPSSEDSDGPTPVTEFQRFFDRLPSQLLLAEVVEQWRNGQDPSGLGFLGLSDEARADALTTLNYWNAIKRLNSSSGPRFNGSTLMNMLVALGFTIPSAANISQMGRSPARVEADVRCEPIANRRVCPVPDYGSDAQGRYRLLCLYPKAGEIEASEIPTAQRTIAPTLVFFLGVLSREGRNKIIRQSKENRCSLLVIDDAMVLFLALRAQGRLHALFWATLPYTISYPYRSRQAGMCPPEMFFGRAAERDTITQPEGKCFVFGGRQLGKTVLLREVERSLHNPEAGSIVRWIDLPGHGVGRSCAPNELWTLLVRELNPMGIIRMTWPDFRCTEQKHISVITEDVRLWLDADQDRRILLLLDESDDFLRNDARDDYPVTRQLKTLMERTRGRFKPVFVGLHNVLRSTREANNPLVHLGSVEIGPLYADGESREAFEMVRLPFAAMGYRFAEDSLILRILAACNYYPNLIGLFCRELLERVRRSDTMMNTDGLRIISEQLVSEIYESTSLREQIRHYFVMTLQLDTRYEFIANWLAQQYLQKQMDSSEGLRGSVIRAAAIDLWSDGFRSTTEEEFDTLLFEMVGLGILRRVSGGACFTFRNPNVLQLMGSANEIDDRLTTIVVEGELPSGFDANTFRGPLTVMGRSAQRSPLSITQESFVASNKNEAMIICGAGAMGLPDIPELLKSRQAFSEVKVSSALTQDMCIKELDGVRQHAKIGLNVLYVPESLPWDLEWAAAAHRVAGSSTASVKFVKTMFAASPSMLWALACKGKIGQLNPSTNHQASPSVICLRPWSDPFVRSWLEDLNMPAERAARRAVFEATNGYPALLYQLQHDLDPGPQFMHQVNAFRDHLKSSERAHAVLEVLGCLANEQCHAALVVMRDFGGDPIADMAQFWDKAQYGVSLDDFVRWGDLLGLLQPAGAPDQWTLDPFIGKLLSTLDSGKA